MNGTFVLFSRTITPSVPVATECLQSGNSRATVLSAARIALRLHISSIFFVAVRHC